MQQQHATTSCNRMQQLEQHATAACNNSMQQTHHATSTACNSNMQQQQQNSIHTATEQPPNSHQTATK
eukprot:4702641-Lingulodinium_polyedra.AAC.1